jgi:hypothetical protein
MMETNQLIHLLSPLGEYPRARTPEQSLSHRIAGIAARARIAPSGQADSLQNRELTGGRGRSRGSRKTCSPLNGCSLRGWRQQAQMVRVFMEG